MPRLKIGSGNIYRRGRVWWMTYMDGDGRRVRESAKTRDEKEARRKLRSIIGEREKGILVPRADRVTTDELLDAAIRDYEIKGHRTTSDAKKRRQHLLKFFGGRRVQAVRDDEVVEYVRRRQAAKAANGTINRELALLRKALRMGVKSRAVVVVPNVEMLKEAPPRRVFFTHDEFKRLLACLPPELRPACTFAFLVGWRKEEVFLLQWRHVDLDASEITLPRELSKNAEGRTIKLAGKLKAVIHAQHAANPDGCTWVFHRNGRRIKDFRAAWLKALCEASVEGKVFHDFRRTAVRNMVRSGIPERVAMQISGHKTRDVFGRYDIVAGTDLEAAAERIDSFFNRGFVTMSVTEESPSSANP